MTPSSHPTLRRLLLVPLAVATAWLLVVGCGGSTDSATPPDAPPAEDLPSVGQPDWVNDAVLYEIFVPDFSQQGTFQGVINRLDTLQAMGVTTLWLMPIHPVGEKRAKTEIGPLGSPYAVRDYKGVNPQYGGEDGFRALVDSVHARGMYIIIDWVANHTAWDHPWIEAHPEYYTEGPVDGRFSYPLMDGDTTDWTDVVDLNFDNAEMRAKMIDAMQYWVREYNIDGFRCDVAHEVPHDFWKTAIDSLESIRPVLMLAEAEEVEFHDDGFDWTYAWPFYGALKGVWEEGDSLSHLITQVDTTLADLPDGARRLRFTTNHDESAWDASPVDIFGGEAGSQAAFVLSSSLPGVPLVYNGQELGVRDTVSFFEATPYDWSRDDTMLPFYDRFLSFYNESEALRRGSYEVVSTDSVDAMLFRRATADQQVLVAVNVRDAETTLDIPDAYASRTLTDVMTGETIADDPLTLGPYQWHILRVE